MFGPQACANQTWYSDFVKKYPMAGNKALGGVVPKNYLPVVQDTAARSVETPVLDEQKSETCEAQTERMGLLKQSTTGAADQGTDSSPQTPTAETNTPMQADTAHAESPGNQHQAP